MVQEIERFEAPLFTAAIVRPGLFTAEVERQTSTGATVRVTVEPVDGELVRVLSYERRRRGATTWERIEREEGRVMPWEQLGSGVAFAAVFTAAGAAS